MATFTWTATGAGTTSWETPADWFNTSAGHPTSTSFTASPGNDYLINGGNLFTINQIGAGGTTAPDVANSLTASDLQAKLLMADGGALNVTNTLSLNSLLNLGTTTGGSVLTMGGTAGGGTISLGSRGVLEGAKNDSIQDAGTSPTQIIGGGTILAEGGIFLVGTSVQVAATATTQFQIGPNATLSFADAVGGGTIVFGTTLGPSGSSVLDVAALSTFRASLNELSVGVGKNNATSYIDFLNVGTSATATLTNITSSGGTLNIFTNTGSQSLAIIGNYVGRHVNYVSDGANGTNVFLTDTPCYAAGTAILTPGGEVAVESIRSGDLVMTSANGTVVPRTVIWTGLREIDMTRHPVPEKVAPVRFRPGALGPDRPRRDLVLSPDHCLFIDGGLIPAKLLVNGMSIVRDLGVSAVTYHHIELDRHAVLIAEGVEAESYLDAGNRAFFSNAGLATLLHPELGINERLCCWDTDSCAPLTVEPELVRPVWERVAHRAARLGCAPPVYSTTTDAGIYLMIDGRAVRPLSIQFQTLSFMVPEGARSVRLLSRSILPNVLRPWLDDGRKLGVAIRLVTLRDRIGETVIGADHPALIEGWHTVEYAPDGTSWRWSSGDAVLPIVADGPCVLEITLSETTSYLVDLAA